MLWQAACLRNSATTFGFVSFLRAVEEDQEQIILIWKTEVNKEHDKQFSEQSLYFQHLNVHQFDSVMFLSIK